MFPIDKKRHRAAGRGYGKIKKIKVPEFNEKWSNIFNIYDFIIFSIVSQENITCVI